MSCLTIDRVVRSCNVILSVFSPSPSASLQVCYKSNIKCDLWGAMYLFSPMQLENMQFYINCIKMRTTIQQYTWFWKSWEQLSISFFVKLIIHNVGLVWCKVHVDGVIPISVASLHHEHRVQCGYVSKPSVLLGLWLVIFCNTCT